MGRSARRYYGAPVAAMGGVALPPTTAMEAWFRKGVGITSAANAVSNWANQAVSGAARDYAQATGANQPTLQAGGTILFDGTSDFLKTAAFTLGQPYTRYLRVKPITWVGSAYIFDGAGVNSGAVRQSGGSPNLDSQGSADLINMPLPLGSFSSLVLMPNGAGASVLQVGATAITGTAAAGTPSGLTLGAIGGGISNWSNIEVAEEIVYSVVHDAAQRAAVIAYLNTL